MSYSTSYPSLTLHVVLYLALASVPFTASLDPTCHYPDGTVALTDIPCNNNGSAAACCGPNYYCLSNGLCWGDLHIGRGSCTDPTWQTPECAQVCRNENPSGGKGLGICSSSLFSCDYQTCAQQNFSISDLPNIKLVFRDDQLKKLGLQSSASTAKPTTSNALAAAKPTVSNALAASATQRTTSLPSLLLTSSTPTAAPPGSADHKTVMAVGVGIGVPLGLCALAGLVMLLFARKKIKKLTSEKEQAEADLLAYKKAREIYDQQFPRIYEAPPPNTELDVGPDYHQLHS